MCFGRYLDSCFVVSNIRKSWNSFSFFFILMSINWHSKLFEFCCIDLIIQVINLLYGNETNALITQQKKEKN